MFHVRENNQKVDASSTAATRRYFILGRCFGLKFTVGVACIMNSSRIILNQSISSNRARTSVMKVHSLPRIEYFDHEDIPLASLF